jgi:cobalamin synthase
VRCELDKDARVDATAAVSQYVRAIVERTFPQADADALATAVWALVHGLAFLHLDGKLDTSNPSVVAERIAAAINALLTATNLDPGVVR